MDDKFEMNSENIIKALTVVTTTRLCAQCDICAEVEGCLVFDNGEVNTAINTTLELLADKKWSMVVGKEGDVAFRCGACSKRCDAGDKHRAKDAVR